MEQYMQDPIDESVISESMQQDTIMHDVGNMCSVSLQTDDIIFPHVLNEKRPKHISIGTQTQGLISKTKSIHTQYDENDFTLYPPVLELHSYCKQTNVNNILTLNDIVKTGMDKNVEKHMADDGGGGGDDDDDDSGDFDDDGDDDDDDSGDCDVGDDYVDDDDVDDDDVGDDDDDDDDVDVKQMTMVDVHTNSGVHKEQKHIVFESSIANLFQRCQICGACITCLQKRNVGSMVTFVSTCIEGHDFKWYSQPMIRKMPAGNLLLSAAMLYTGASFTQMSSFAKLLNLTFIGNST